MSTDIGLAGVSVLVAKLEAMNANANRVENAALKKAAQPILDDMKSTTSFHNRTGDLRKALSAGHIKTKNGVKSIQIGIDKSDNSQVYYGKFTEFGSKHQSARPFIQPAYERHKKEAIEIIKNELRDALK